MKKNIKQLILSSLLAIYTRALRLRRTSRLGHKQIRSILILPPYMPGSLGDEAMVSASVEYLKSKGHELIGLVSYSSALHWESLGLMTETVNFPHNSWKAKFRFANAVSQYERFYCLGADMLDGYYTDDAALQRLKLVSLAAETGTDAAILGFSFNDQPTPASIQALRNLPSSVRLCCRDPVSHVRLSRHLQRPVELVADLAFLLQPVDDSEIALDVSQWISQQQANGRIVIGINANGMHVRHLKVQLLDNLIQIYVNTLVELYSKDEKFSFVLIPHDFHSTQGAVSDIVLVEAILKALPAKMQSHCINVPTPCRAAEIKFICRNLDIVLGGRMHLAISCLGQGTPVACATYQGKFEGLFSHFELDGMTIEPEQAFQPEGLVKFLMPLIEKRKDISKRIQLKLPQVQQLAQVNFV